MRVVHLTDLDLAVRVLLAHPPQTQGCAARRMVSGARVADRYRKRLQRRHPDWGDGSLSSAALAIGRPVPPSPCNASYRRALTWILLAFDGPDGFDFAAADLYEGQAIVMEDRNHGKPAATPAQHRSRLGSHY